MAKCVKVQITVDSDLLSRADNYADNNYTSRSGLIGIALRQYLDSQDLAQSIQRMSVAMQVIAEKGEIDEDVKKELDTFKALSEILSSRIN